MAGWIEHLNDWPLAGYMVVVALGFTLGRITWRGFSLGPAGGTIVVALLFARAGVSIEKMYGGAIPSLTLGLFGFALFIYSVGFEAGPRFFGSLRHRSGWSYVAIGVLVNFLAIGTALACNEVFDLGASGTPGVLAGGLTSLPTYAAALEVCDDPTRLAYAFATTYPFGIAGVVLLIQFLPRMLRTDLAAGTQDDDSDSDADGAEVLALRSFAVVHEGVVGPTLAELDLTHATGCTITRLHRGTSVSVPDAQTRLVAGDHVSARGTVDQLHEFERIVGPEIYDEELRRRLPSGRAVRVQAPDVDGKTLAELEIIGKYHCVLTQVRRGRAELTPSADLRLARDDVVHVAGARENVQRVAARLGRFERSTNETDVAVYAFGIFLGILLGRAHIGKVYLGFAGGLLLSGLLLGRYRRIGPLSAHVPVAARQLVRDLGILLFVAEAGLRTGVPTDTGVTAAFALILAGMATTVIPLVLTVAVGQYLLRMRPVDAWGSACGGMTSSAALVALLRAADSNEPALSYVGAYAVGSVLLTMAGPLVVWLAG
ncbi:MAG: aspartate-alanine antiporter-like transporter [Planctomycetota bacterium]|jgi:putative transport protein